jgi:hypothetical protein
MLTRELAIDAADQAAGTCWRATSAPQSFGWRDGLEVRSAGALAQFVAGDRRRTAAELYAFAVKGGARAAVPFERVPPALRVACEVFRGTLIVLLDEIERQVPVRVVPAPEPVRPVRAVPDAELDASVVKLERVWSRDDGRPAKRRPRSGPGNGDAA